jgi:hypothetical protein
VALTSAPWALDGARTPASIARLAARAAVKESGIINPGDMKVLQLSTPGDGVRISSGGAVLENRYEADVNQAYVVEATSEEILDSDENFVGILGQGTTQHHLVCVTIGDPQYSTSGHPWFTETMKNDLAASPEDALDFQYTRAWVIKNVPAGTERVEDLPSPPSFPCYALARLEVPNGTGSITSGMIKDVRQVVNRRTKTHQTHVGVSTPDVLSVPAAFTYETWPDNSVTSVYVPEWATKVYIQGYIYGFVQGSDLQVDSPMRVAMRTSADAFIAANQQTVYYTDEADDNKMVMLAGPISIPLANRGTTCKFSTEASYSSTAMNERLGTTTRTSVSLTLRFVEEAV